jgi:hypothetical protein
MLMAVCSFPAESAWEALPTPRILLRTRKGNYIFISICFYLISANFVYCVKWSSLYTFTDMNRARDGTAFVQSDKLLINTKYLILDATHHVTRFGAEIVLIIWDSLNKRCLKVFWPKKHV